jgi:hypothetical protein
MDCRRASERGREARASSDAEWYEEFPVLLRRASAFRARRTGWNVSGTKTTAINTKKLQIIRI